MPISPWREPLYICPYPHSARDLPLAPGQMLPDLPAYSGSIAADWNTLWFWLEAQDDGQVWFLNASTYSSGWQQFAGGVTGGFGRKVFIRGGAPLSGCWFSTDYDAEDTWIGGGTINPGYVPNANSMNDFATAKSGAGPWTTFSGTAPWAPRASAAVTSSWRSTSAYVASGMTFVNGVASAPTFADVWQIDVGICLLAPSSKKVCNGLGTPDLYNVWCVCVAGVSGPFCETGSPASNSQSSAGGSGPATAIGVSFGVILAIGGALYVFVTRFGGKVPFVSEAASAAGALLQKVLGGGGSSGGGSGFAPRSYSPVATSSGAGASSSPGYGSL